MTWFWAPCSGHSGGLLMGVDKEMATVSDGAMGEFFRATL